MSEITLEKVDLVRERTGVSYSKAKEALEAANGDVLEAIIYLENKSASSNQEKNYKEEVYTSFEELKETINKLIEKGNVSRIVIKKDDKVLVDVPVNAGIAVGVIGLIWTPLIPLAMVTTVAMKLTIEITKVDGTVEVVNKIVKTKAQDVKSKVSDIADDVMDKVQGTVKDIKGSFSPSKSNEEEDNMYTYTVKFDNEDEK